MQTIEITGVTGTGPFKIYICDPTLVYCFEIATTATVPPNIFFSLPYTFSNPFPPPINITFGETSSLVIKIVDQSNGCSKFIPYYCVTPTPTPSITPTITPTPSSCRCQELYNPTAGILYFDYVECSNVLQLSQPVPPGTHVYVCGNSVVADPSLIHITHDVCYGGSCPDTVLTPTPTPTQTLTPTPSSIGTGKLYQFGDVFIFMNNDIYIFQNQ